MTYGECKEKIRDLGFEENSTMQEYSSIVKNSVQRAIQFIFDGIVIRYRAYYQHKLSTPEIPWFPVRPAQITADTPDDFVIELPDDLVELVPMLASYYVWLDDDQVKATLYWNAFDASLNDVVASITRNIKGVITGGVRW